MRICLIHRQRKVREVLTRAFSCKLNTEEVVGFSSCEHALASSLDGYNVFVVYSNGQGKMSGGVGGIRKIRFKRPDAFIVGVGSALSRDWQMIPAGADTLVLRTGHETTRLISAIEIKKLIGAIRKGADKP